MVHELGELALKSGERVSVAVVCGPDAGWRDRIERLLGHKGEPWRWQNHTLLAHDAGIEARFYLLHRHGQPFSHQMTAELAGVGIFGHVWTEPADRGQGAADQLLAAVMRDFQARGGRALVLGTTHDTPAFRLYQKHGFSGVEPHSGVMTWSRGPFAEFTREYFTPGQTAAIEPPAWRHWPVAPALFACDEPGIVRCAALGMFGRQTSESALLPYVHAQMTGEGQTGLVRLLRLANGAVAGLAAICDDPLAPGARCVDVHVHSAYTAHNDALLDAVLAGAAAGLRTAYADPAQTGRIAALRRHGFRHTATWPQRLAADAAGNRRADLLMFDRSG